MGYKNQNLIKKFMRLSESKGKKVYFNERGVKSERGVSSPFLYN